MTTDSNPHSPDEKACGWQPIETAPKDGTRVIVMTRDGVTLGFQERRLVDVQPDRYETMWFRDDDERKCHVTHWMPLPEPPR